MKLVYTVVVITDDEWRAKHEKWTDAKVKAFCEEQLADALRYNLALDHVTVKLTQETAL